MNIKHLLSGVAVIAALAVATPVWAQTAGGNSYGGNSMGVPGPNPGGPEVPGTVNGGLFGHTPSPPPASASVAPATRHYVHRVPHLAAHRHRMAPVAGDTANQLNREELANLQSGGSMPASQDAMNATGTSAGKLSRSGGNAMGMPGPNPGGPGLTLYNR